MDNSIPLISIITVTLNSKDLLNNTIKSVIAQSYPSIEFIVIDGGSTDGSLEILNKYKTHISYWSSENDNGIYDAMNKGLAKANGKYVNFLNAGETFFSSDSLSEIISISDDDHDIIYGDILLVDEKNGIQRHHKAMEFSLDNLKRFGTGVLCHQAMLVKRKIAKLYNCSYKYKAELNWYFDILESHPNCSLYHYKTPFVVYSLGGIGYQNFISNRFEWYRLLVKRYGRKAVFNKQFLGFIYQDFKNRYTFLNRLKKYHNKALNFLGLN